MDLIGRTRASVEVRATPNGAIDDALGPDIAVIVLEEEGEWLKISPAGVSGAVPGYVPRLAVALPPPAVEPVFPSFNLPDGEHPTVPATLPAQNLVDWLAASDAAPPWIPANLWEQLNAAAQAAVRDSILAAISARQLDWEDWQRELESTQRLAEATIDEWLVILQGGRNMWTLRSERIYKRPSQDTSEGHNGWVGDKDILLWSGHVQENPAETKYQTWYEVRLHKFRKELRGWYKADLLAEYAFPSAQNDTANRDNASTVFDLTQSLLRLPADQAIEDAKTAKRNAWQYLDVEPVTGKRMIHYNLCGEFCVAALLGLDVLPLLAEWAQHVPGAMEIVKNKDAGTGLAHLQSMLALRGIQGETFQYSSSVSQISPAMLRQALHNGRKAIIGVGITRRGLLTPEGHIRHWVILEDAIPVGSGGWMRLYNPFFNRDEVYNYRDFLGSMGNFGIGMWVTHP